VSRAASPFRTAQADALERIGRGPYFRGELRLTRAAYEYLGGLGFSRADVARAVDQLVQDGRARLRVSGGSLVVRLVVEDES
jgi:hypothetical protein